MKLKKGSNPMCAAGWSRPQQIVKKDGTELCTAIDSTYVMGLLTAEKDADLLNI